MKYFKLKPEVYLILGSKRAVLHNLIAEKIIWLNENATELLRKAELNEILSETECKQLQPLVNEGWGDFSNSPIYTDKLRKINVFNEKKFHKNTPIVNSAVLQIINECNKSCEFCNEFFCPSCIIKKNGGNALNMQEWLGVLDKLEIYGVQKILLTGGEVALSPYLLELINEINSRNIQVSIHTNGVKKIERVPEYVHIIISLFDETDIQVIKSNYSNFNNVTILVYNENDIILKKIPKKWTVIKSSIKPLTINKERMVNKGFEDFSLRKNYDKCLSGKVYVAYDGKVYPCFQSKEVVGDIKKEKWHLIMKKLVLEYWKNGVDKWDDRKCRSCEFRYVCNSCRFYCPQEYCSYNVEESQWK